MSRPGFESTITNDLNTNALPNELSGSWPWRHIKYDIDFTSKIVAEGENFENDCA